ncbi:MAG TPA: 2-oxoacid:acceptor oxidoreductase subunit alpha [Syntrophorhabdales bacterium]|nr:2-oxoacid:acceptor oxidoreductase subunit alpha [Syntrophorhabdales bacterium]
MDYTVKIGGEAGQGVDTVGTVLSKIFTRAGYFVFSHQDYESRIRGGHNFIQIRLSDRPVTASRDPVDILVALDRQSITDHEKELSDSGMVVYDAAALKEKFERPAFLNLPFTEIAVKQGGSKIMSNTVATGAVLGMLGMDPAIAREVIKDELKQKGEQVVKANLDSIEAGHALAGRECLRCSFTLPAAGQKKMLITGNEAIGLGAVLSGCKFYSGYPMTPSTGTFNFVAGKALECGIVVEQAEDEIAAINMAIGASFGGIRSMTASSGGGFSLMVEGLSLAAMTETPLVIGLAQRPGPATGLPTRTEQGELLFALYAGHGEFPRVIFAPGTAEQAVHLTSKAFDLAEKYQIPAILLTDQYLADTSWSYDSLNLETLHTVDYRLRGDAFRGLRTYKRHALTGNGVSPLGIPGDGQHLIVTDSDEHDEEGHIVEDAETRRRMVDKRLLKKMPLIKAEIEPPTLHGSDRPEVVVVGWGSTYGVMKEAVERLAPRNIAMLHFSEIYPFPNTQKLDYLALLRGAKKTICVEQNAMGKFATLVRSETGYSFGSHILKYDGRPFTVESLSGEIDAHVGRV